MYAWLLSFAASSAVAVGLFVTLLPMIEGFGHEVGPPALLGMCVVLGVAGGLGIQQLWRSRQHDGTARQSSRGVRWLGLALLMALGAGGLYAASRPSWSRVSALASDRDHPLPRRMIHALWFEQVTGGWPNPRSIDRNRAWYTARPEHYQALDAKARALLDAELDRQLKHCAETDLSYAPIGEQLWGLDDCLRVLPGIARALPEREEALRALTATVIRHHIAARPDRLLEHTARFRPLKDLGAGEVIEVIVTERLKRAENTVDFGERAQAIEALIKLLKKARPEAIALSPNLPTLKDEALAALKVINETSPIDQPVSLLRYQDAARIREAWITPTLVARFDERFATSPVLARIDAARQVQGLMMTPTPGHVGLRDELRLALTRRARQLAKGHPTALKPGGWATAGDLPIEDQISALTWLADFEGVSALLDARTNHELREAGYTGGRMETWRANNRREIRAHYVKRGFYDGLAAAYVLRTGPPRAVTPPSTVRRFGSIGTPTTGYRRTSTPGYRSTSTPTYRSSPSTYRSTSTSRRGASPSSFRSSSSSGYRSRYSSSSRSSSRSGGYRSGK